MTRTLNPLLAQFAGEPCLVSDDGVEMVESCLNALVAHEDGRRLIEPQASCDENFWLSSDDWRARYRPYVVQDGILQIPVKGVLLHNFTYAFGGYATGYDYIRRAFERGCRDYKAKAIRGIAFVVDTPGGHTAGLFDTTDRIEALKAECKVPVRGFAHEKAASAGYAVISTADHVVMSRTGIVGSIGVLLTHVDYSGMNEQIGLKYTLMFAGKGKTDGHPDQALSDEAKARFQERINELYALFVETVARNRRLDAAAVRELGALTYTAPKAVPNGLADSVGPLDDAVAAFAADLSQLQQEEEAMSDQGNTIDQATHDSAVAAAAATAETAARELVFAIIDSDEGKKRPAAARALAAEGGRTLDQAVAFLAKLPEEPAEGAAAPAGDGGNGGEQQRQTPFDAAMNGGNPNVGKGGIGEEEAQDDGTDAIALARQFGVPGVRRAPASA